MEELEISEPQVMVSLYGLEGLGFRVWGSVQGLGCRGYGGVLELSKLGFRV